MSQIKLIPAFIPMFKTPKKYFYSYGGRGGGKSIAICDLLIALSRQEKSACLCTREVQKSIKESVYSLLKERIEEHELTGEFNLTKDEIRNKLTGFRFIFAGLKDHTVDSIKSYNVKYCWVEEAHSVSQKSIDILIPTLRKDGVRFFFSYNRKKEADPIHVRFKNEFANCEPITKKWKLNGKIYQWIEYNTDDATGVYVNYDGNPYFPETLEKERLKLKAEDYDRYLHVWEGLPEQQGDMCILSRREVTGAMDRTIEPVGGYVLGCDVARFGSDRTVIFLRKGLKVITYKILKKNDTIQVADSIIDMLNNAEGDTKEILLNIDDTGVGGGVTDSLSHRGYNVNPVNFGGKAVEEDKYYNTIAEMWFSFKEVVEEADIPDIPELLEELTDRLYEYDNKERKKIESKDNYKKRAGKSPDIADALLLTYYSKRKEPHAWLI